MLGGIFGLVVGSMALFNSINPGSSRSPCPEYFRYTRNDITGEISGKIEIPRAPKNIALRLRISLSVATALPTKYVGRLELATSKGEAVKAVQRGRPLVYNLYFPLRNPIPLLTEITFNGKRYCIGRRAAGPIVTTIYLEHTLYPPRVIALSENRPFFNYEEGSNDSQNSLIDPAEFNFSPLLTTDSSPPALRPNEKDPSFPIPEKPISYPDQNERPIISDFYPPKPIFRPDSLNLRNKNCGRANTAGVNYLIANGNRTSPGQWPWLVAIFLAKMEFEFQCAGSLITDRHVITAAHCKFNNEVDVPASAFIVSLGRYHLNEWREAGSETREVLHFRPHPEYSNRFNADADIAIMVLRKIVEFTPRIQPLCLWSGPMALERLVGSSGYVVGWGKDENGNQHLKEPRVAVTPIVSQEDCLRSNIAFISSTSNRTFCAGRRDGSGPCNGDSGSGLVIFDSNTGRYHLRGIVSLSLLDKERRSCDLSQYIVYVDAAKFSGWIMTQIK